MSVRIIAGEHRGRRLAVPDVAGLRPTSDRARETLFNVLAPHIPDARVLDVFAGSGAIGIEALSRGAASATFVERDRLATEAIETNLRSCRLEERAGVVAADWRAALRTLAEEGRCFDIAFFDPPYAWSEAHSCLEALAERELLTPSGGAIIEHRRDSPPRDAERWELQRRVDVGDSSFSIFMPGD